MSILVVTNQDTIEIDKLPEDLTGILFLVIDDTPYIETKKALKKWCIRKFIEFNVHFVIPSIDKPVPPELRVGYGKLFDDEVVIPD